MRVVF